MSISYKDLVKWKNDPELEDARQRYLEAKEDFANILNILRRCLEERL